MEPRLEAIKANLFPASHASIDDWHRFLWHPDARRLNSSQALAIDVFGTIKVSNDRDRVLSALARECGIPEEGPWTLKLEWLDPENLLREITQTQVDAIAFGQRAILVIECKFTEAGGGCSQPKPLTNGANLGLSQCSGDYTLQVNRVNNIEARCALSGKGISYWEHIPVIFGIDAAQDHTPCPFRGDAYQWMRNVVLMDRLASTLGVAGAVIGAYAEADGFNTAQKVRAGALGQSAASGKTLVLPMSFQSIVELAQSVSEDPTEWVELAAWVNRKITIAAAQRRSTRADPVTRVS
jgi:hypothetical protein